jgi:hypothetical protein
MQSGPIAPIERPAAVPPGDYGDFSLWGSGPLRALFRRSRSTVGEVVIVAFVYSVGLMLGWRHVEALGTANWSRATTGGSAALTAAGWWYLLVSLPIFQFVLFRWYYRLMIWGRFLWQVSRLDLSLVPTHPDRRAGLGFLSVLSHAFAPFLLVHGVLLAGTIGHGLLYSGATLAQYRIEMASVPITMLLLVLGPQVAFVFKLWDAKRVGLLEYGALAQRYVRDFHGKWVQGERASDEPLIGSADIQSLADLAGSFEIVESMRIVPITRDALLRLALVTVLPLAPLVLTVIPAGELAEKLLRVVF